jgi:hypothetical protein
MTLALIVTVLVLVALLAVRYGADTRDLDGPSSLLR